MIHIEQGQKYHIPTIVDITQQAIYKTAAVAYSPAQLKVWADAMKHESLWENVMKKQVLLLAFEKGQPAGIISLEKGYYIDYLYVHPRFGRKGVAQTLFNAIEKHVSKNRMEVFASKIARPFFKKNGFEVERDNRIHLNGQVLINYKMVKVLV